MTAKAPLALDTAHTNRERKESSPVWLRINAFLDLKSENTQRTYISIIKEWCEFLGTEPGSPAAARAILSATDLHALAYRKWLERRKGQRPRLEPSASDTRALERSNGPRQRRDGLQHTLANSTIAKKFTALRRIYRMLIASALGVVANPFDSDRVPPPAARAGQKRPTEMLDFQMVKAVLDAPDCSTGKGLRDSALLALLFGGGLRRSEVVALRIGDLRQSPGGTTYVRLRATKSKRDADHALPPWAAARVQQLAEQRLQEGAAPGDYLFVAERGPGAGGRSSRGLTASGLYRIFKDYCRQTGAGMFITPHSARATAITKLLADGLNHREVQEFSRHASVQMVEVYDKRRYGVDKSPAKDLDYDK